MNAPPQPRDRWWLWLLLSAAACGNGAAAPRSLPPPRAVQLHTVGVEPLPRKAAVTGILAAQEELVVSLEVPGRLMSLAVDVGAVVAKGALLAELDPRDLQLAVARAEAALAAAEARLGVAAGLPLSSIDVENTPAVREAKAVLAEAALQRDRIAAMVQQNASSGAGLDTAAAALAVADSRLQRARDDVRTNVAEIGLRRIERQQADKRLADSRVVAPWAGRVAVRHASVGQVLSAGAAVVTLLRIDLLRLQLRVPDRLAAEVEVGQAVEFTVDGGGSALQTGRIVRQLPLIERGDRTRLVEAEVGNADGALLPGAFCRAKIVLAAAVPTVVVPKSAVSTFAGVDRVFTVAVAKDGTVAKGLLVQLGRDLGDGVEVVSGLAAGQSIVRDARGLSPELPILVDP